MLHTPCLTRTADPSVHFSKLIWHLEKEVAHSEVYSGFINLDIFWHLHIYLFVRTQTLSLDSTHSFIHELPGLDFHVNPPHTSSCFTKWCDWGTRTAFHLWTTVGGGNAPLSCSTDEWQTTMEECDATVLSLLFFYSSVSCEAVVFVCTEVPNQTTK